MFGKHSFKDIAICFFANMLHEIWGVIPAAILLFLHFRFRLTIWYAVIVLILWLLIVAVRTGIIAFANANSEGVVIDHENKNPLSAKTDEVFKK